MRKEIFIAALLATTIATPALARDGAAYVELDGGVMFVDDFDLKVNGTGNAGRLRADSRDFGVKVDGAEFGAAVGYDFGAFRVEAEGSYRTVRNGGLTLGNRSFPNVAGKSEALSAMGNAMLDIGSDDGFQGFIGGGAGWAKVSHDLGGSASLLDDSDSGLAWQVLAGVRAPLSESMDVGVKYRFFNVSNVDLVSGNDDDIRTRWRSHSLMGTFTFNFGGRRETVEEVVAPPPPPPPPPATMTCPDGTVVGMNDACPAPPPPPMPAPERG